MVNWGITLRSNHAQSVSHISRHPQLRRGQSAKWPDTLRRILFHLATNSTPQHPVNLVGIGRRKETVVTAQAGYNAIIVHTSPLADEDTVISSCVNHIFAPSLGRCRHKKTTGRRTNSTNRIRCITSEFQRVQSFGRPFRARKSIAGTGIRITIWCLRAWGVRRDLNPR